MPKYRVTGQKVRHLITRDPVVIEADDEDQAEDIFWQHDQDGHWKDIDGNAELDIEEVSDDIEADLAAESDN